MPKIQCITTTIALPLRNWGELEDYLETLEARVLEVHMGESLPDPAAAAKEPPKAKQSGRRHYQITWSVYKSVKSVITAHPSWPAKHIQKHLNLPHSVTTISRIIRGDYDTRFADVDENGKKLGGTGHATE